jgi:hypothetical protein
VWHAASSRLVVAIHLEGGGTDFGAAAFSADGRLVACGGTGAVSIYALPAGTLLRRIPDAEQAILYEGSDFSRLSETLKTARILSLDFKPTGHRLLIGTDRGVFEVDYLRCDMTWRLEPAAEPATMVRYAPGGSDFILNAGKLEYLSNYRPAARIHAGPAGRGQPVSAATFTRDGTHLAVLSPDGRFSVIRVSDQKLVMQTSPGKLDGQGVAISTDGRNAWVGSQGNVERFTRIPMPQDTWREDTDLE